MNELQKAGAWALWTAMVVLDRIDTHQWPLWKDYEWYDMAHEWMDNTVQAEGGRGWRKPIRLAVARAWGRLPKYAAWWK